MTITTERLDALEAKATNQPLIPSYSGMLGDEGVKDVLLYLIAEIRRLQSECQDWNATYGRLLMAAEALGLSQVELIREATR